MITKEKFVEYLRQLEEIYDKNCKKNDALNVVFPETKPWIENDSEISLIIHLLEELVPEACWDNTDYYTSDIEWWYYEYVCSFHEPRKPLSMTITVDGKETPISISTPEELYDSIFNYN